MGTQVPEEELIKVSAHTVEADSIINIEEFREDTYDFLMRVVAILLKMFKT